MQPRAGGLQAMRCALGYLRGYEREAAGAVAALLLVAAGSPPPDDHGSTSPLGRITVIRWRFLTCPGGNDDKWPAAYRRRGQHHWEKARCSKKVIFDAAHSFVLRQWALLRRNSESWVPHPRSLIRPHRLRTT